MYPPPVIGPGILARYNPPEFHEGGAMANKGTKRWAVLLLASFAAHIALTVNSTDTALWNEQGREGALLVQQLADAAAPLVLARDRVSLSVLASQYEHHAGIASVRLYNSRNELVAETLERHTGGRAFRANIRLQQQALGHVELRLAELSRGDIVRLSLGNIGLSALLHALIFGAGLMLGPRPATTQTAAPAVPPAPASTPEPVGEMPDEASEETSPVTLLHLVLDDPNGLLTRVNASMADELLSLFDQFIDRAAQLYGGQVEAPFSPAGVVVSFRQPDAAEREFHAIAAASLFLQLVNDAAEERRQHGRLCLGGKAGIVHSETGHESLPAIAGTLAQLAPSGRILGNLPESSLVACCRLAPAHRLAITEQDSLQVALVEALAPEYQQLVRNQSQQILGLEDED